MISVGLYLVVAAIVFWNTVYLEQASPRCGPPG
jgi:TnpA family transposase